MAVWDLTYPKSVQEVEKDTENWDRTDVNEIKVVYKNSRLNLSCGTAGKIK